MWQGGVLGHDGAIYFIPRSSAVWHLYTCIDVGCVDGMQGTVLHRAVGQHQWYHFGGRCTTHFGLFSGDWDVHWGVRDFDPWPWNSKAEQRGCCAWLTMGQCPW